MDAYYRKTRRPIANLSSSLKRPPPKSHISQAVTETITTTASTTTTTTPTKTLSSNFHSLYDRDVTPQSPPKTPRRPKRSPAESPPRPSTPTNARLTRPSRPPPVKRKIIPDDPRRRRKPTLTVKELFKSAHPHEESDGETSNDDDRQKSPNKQHASITSSPRKRTKESTTDTTEVEETTAEFIGLKKLVLPATPPATPRKIASGPLKGISTSLLDLIRAKEAKAKESPEKVRQRELLGIAPEIARIVPTVFTAHKRAVMSQDIVIDKCFKALRSNYSTLTIIECLELMNKVAPEWVTIVEISRGKFMRLNKDKYTVPQLLEAIKRYKGEKGC